MRTRLGLPFVCTEYMSLLIEGIIARVQRNAKVTLCHLVLMGNHPHILVIAKDSVECTKFYGEIQKQLTEAIKRLLGLRYLNLWKKNGTSVVPLGDLAGVCERIAYIYANPSKAHLVDRIEGYRGQSSWEAFEKAPATLSASYSKLCPWVRSPAIPKLPTLSMTRVQDRTFTERLRSCAKKQHELVLQPNAWMRAFGVRDDGVERINKAIVARLRVMEADKRRERNEKNFRVKGAEKLQREALSLNYHTKSKSRRIFVYAADPEIRTKLIEDYRHFCALCDACYRRWKLGDYTVQWPPGAFVPPMPPRANWFAC